MATRPGMLGRVAGRWPRREGGHRPPSTLWGPADWVVRDITIEGRDSHHGQQIVNGLEELTGVKVDSSDRTFLVHLGGKIEIRPKVSIGDPRRSVDGVHAGSGARVPAIRDDRRRAFSVTMKHNSVVLVAGGMAVLGLGDIGSEAALPVMEDKSVAPGVAADVARAAQATVVARRRHRLDLSSVP